MKCECIHIALNQTKDTSTNIITEFFVIDQLFEVLM